MFWAAAIVGIWVGSSLLALLLVVLKVVLSGKRVRRLKRKAGCNLSPYRDRVGDTPPDVRKL